MCINLLRCAVTTHINIYIIYLSQMKNSLTPRFSLRICSFPTTNTFLQDTAPSTSFSLIHTVKGTSASASSAHGNLTVHYFLENGFNTVPPLIRLSPPFVSEGVFRVPLPYTGFFLQNDYIFFLRL